ncbi:MAG: cell division protein ZapD [Gammaproteobacteria bacterium]|nr:cell division protein ZapD [Gammaproteobacteria bacterium]
MLNKITYEQPLNEKMRTFLRLELLFLQVQHNLEGSAEWNSRATLTSLIEILNVCSRTDLKTELLRELERHGAMLARLEQVPEVDQSRLKELLSEVDVLIDRLHATSGQFGQSLRNNEFICSIRQRSSIPGGLCDFDLPMYHYWLQRPAKERLENLREWLSPIEPMWQSIELILRLTRESAVPVPGMAVAGFFQRSLDQDTPCQLVRVTVPARLPYYPEISGGKHRFTVRFLAPVTDGRTVQSAEDVKFELTCCMS